MNQNDVFFLPSFRVTRDSGKRFNVPGVKVECLCVFCWTVKPGEELLFKDLDSDAPVCKSCYDAMLEIELSFSASAPQNPLLGRKEGGS